MDETQLHVPDRVEPSQTPVIVADYRELLLAWRQSLLMQIAAIERCLGMIPAAKKRRRR